jgi:hypothetical protein
MRIEKLRAQKNADELRAIKEKMLPSILGKNNFPKVGAYSFEQRFICGDPNGVIQWISGEAEAFEEIFSDRGDLCAFAGARGATSILEKAGCEHTKVVAHSNFAFLVDDIKNPLAEATTLGGKFYSEIWLKGGREVADEATKRNEKESHDALEAAKKAEEAAERARLIGTSIVF